MTSGRRAGEIELIPPRSRFRYIRDPVYGYIIVTRPTSSSEVAEESLLVSPWIQRLRRIHQNQTVFTAYPSATHTRYQHSLGVMHLAGKFARGLYQPYYEARRSRSLPSPNYVEEVFRLAGLFHDVGHGPMSHLFDTGYSKQFGTNHEQIGRLIFNAHFRELVSEISRSPHGSCDKINPEHVLLVLYAPVEQPAPSWIRILRPLLSDPVFDVDKADYLMRDSLFTGTREYGAIDWRGIYYRMWYTDEGIAYHRTAAGILSSFCESRFRMYQNVYFHHRAQEAELSILATVKRLAEHHRVGDPAKNLGAYLAIDDHCFDRTAREWALGTDDLRPLGQAWVDALDGKPRLRQAYRIDEHTIGGGRLRGVIEFLGGGTQGIKALEDSIAGEFDGGDDVSIQLKGTPLDIRPENPAIGGIGGRFVNIYEDGDSAPRQYPSAELLAGLPEKYFVLGVFSDCSDDDRARLKQLCTARFRSAGRTLVQDTSY
ncbi:MAG: HD domain-containing protein [Candidatus Krumholzibacteriia bacterium]